MKMIANRFEDTCYLEEGCIEYTRNDKRKRRREDRTGKDSSVIGDKGSKMW